MIEVRRRPGGLNGPNRIIVGVLMVLGGLGAAMATGYGSTPLVLVGVLWIIRGATQSEVVMRLEDDHVMIDRPRNLVLYRDIDAVVVESGVKAHLSALGKNIALPMRFLSDADRQRVPAYLEQEMKKAKAPPSGAEKVS